jgi:hypothetical protein
VVSDQGSAYIAIAATTNNIPSSSPTKWSEMVQKPITSTTVQTASASGNNASAIATCPAGTVAIGGGGTSSNAGRPLASSAPTVGGAVPTDGQTPDGWEAQVSGNASVSVYVLCS